MPDEEATEKAQAEADAKAQAEGKEKADSVRGCCREERKAWSGWSGGPWSLARGPPCCRCLPWSTPGGGSRWGARTRLTDAHAFLLTHSSSP